MMTQTASSATQAAQRYYDSKEADEFYFNIWGGEDIHIGLYDDDREDDSIFAASRRTIDHMLDLVGAIEPDTRVLDLGAGYGGAARLIATRYDCEVVCLNLSETQNQRNRKLCAKARLARVRVCQGNFEHPPFPADSFDLIWSQDALLHSGARQRVIDEVARMLRPGGRFVFTDPMRQADVPVDSLGPILERIHLDNLASFEFYRQAAASAGLVVEGIDDLSAHLPRHYAAVRRELLRRRAELERLSSTTYVRDMLDGLQRWIDAGEAGLLAWGVIALRKPGS